MLDGNNRHPLVFLLRGISLTPNNNNPNNTRRARGRYTSENGSSFGALSFELEGGKRRRQTQRKRQTKRKQTRRK
jgi:hypothetical protein